MATSDPRRATARALVVCLALHGCGAGGSLPHGAVSLVSVGSGGLVAGNAANVISNAGAAVVANNGGALSGTLRGPAAGLIANNAAGLISNNAGGLVSNNAAGLISNNAGGLVSNNAGGLVSNNAGGLVSNNAGGYVVLDLAASTVPQPGAQVTVVDANGQALTDKPVTTDAQGHFELDNLKPSVGLVFVRAAYDAEGQAVSLAAAVSAPRNAGLTPADVDPASTLVSKKVSEMLRAGAVDPAVVTPQTLGKITSDLGLVMTEKALVAAAILPDNQAAKIFDSMLTQSPALDEALTNITQVAGASSLLGSTPTLPAPATLQPLAPAARPVQVTTFAGDGTSGYKEGARAQAEFEGPSAVVRDTDGSFYVAEALGQRIRRIDPTGTVSTVAGDGLAGLFDGATASFNGPNGLALDGAGNLFVADTNNHCIRQIVLSTGMTTTLVGDGTPGSVDGAVARFNSPTDLVYASGNLFVTDAGNQRIRKIDMSDASHPVVSTLSGTGVAGFADGPLASAVFNQPEAITADAKGNLYVADRGNFRIRVISQDSVTTLAGSGTAGSLDGPASTAQFQAPTGVALDAAGNVYISDTGSQHIRMIAPSGAVTTLAGKDPGFSDGAGAGAEFNGPLRLMADVDGTLYVPDYFNQLVRKIK